MPTPQERVILVYPGSHHKVEFLWPEGWDGITVTQLEGNKPTDKGSIFYSVEEAHELFNQLTAAGAY